MHEVCSHLCREDSSSEVWVGAENEKERRPFFVFGHNVQQMGSQSPDQGSKLGPLQWKCRVLTTGPPGTSQDFFFLIAEVEKKKIVVDVQEHDLRRNQLKERANLENGVHQIFRCLKKVGS